MSWDADTILAHPDFDGRSLEDIKDEYVIELTERLGPMLRGEGADVHCSVQIIG
jgi:hypothetical protein